MWSPLWFRGRVHVTVPHFLWWYWAGQRWLRNWLSNWFWHGFWLRLPHTHGPNWLGSNSSVATLGPCHFRVYFLVTPRMVSVVATGTVAAAGSVTVWTPFPARDLIRIPLAYRACLHRLPSP